MCTPSGVLSQGQETSNDKLISRFVEELPKENIEKEELKEAESEDFFFNQDIDYNEGIRSPGWARLQKKKLKRIKNMT